MQLPPKKVVLTLTDNKCQLTRIICEKLVQDQEIQQERTSDNKFLLQRNVIGIQRADMKTTREDADNNYYCSTDGSHSK